MTTVKNGSKGNDVKTLQTLLNEKGYNCGKVDGIFGKNTENAVKQFQKDNGLSVDGIVGTKTWEALQSHPTIKNGSRGSAVKEAQTILNNLGYNAGSVDGIFGTNTENAVKQFQQNMGLSVDGIVGKNTWDKLLNSTNEYPTIKKGSKNNYVTIAQNRLNELGYEAGSADGIFGTNTENAVKAFQSANGLSVDGIIGKNTWAKLNSDSAVPASAISEPATEHFKLSEYRCKDGSLPPKSMWPKIQENMNLLEKIRAELGGHAITITSGYRSPEYNEQLRKKDPNGVAKDSQHLHGTAADIQVSGVSPSKVYQVADRLNPNGGVGKYSTFTHVDVRGKHARW